MRKRFYFLLMMPMIMLVVSCGSVYIPNTYYPSSYPCDSLSNPDYEDVLTIIDSLGNETFVDFHLYPITDYIGGYTDRNGFIGVSWTAKSYIDERKTNSCYIRLAYCVPYGSNLLGTYQWIDPVIQDSDVGIMVTLSNDSTEETYYSESGIITVLESDFYFRQNGSWNSVYYGIVRNASGKRLRIKCGKFGFSGK